MGATKGALVCFLGSLKNLTAGLIWLLTRVGGMGGEGVGEVAHGGRGKGGGRWGGGHQRAVWEQGGGTRESSVGATKVLAPACGLP